MSVKKKADSDSKPGLSIDISPELMAEYERAQEEALKSKRDFKSDDNPMVTKYSYDSMEKDYKDKIKDLQSKLDEARKDRDQARNERDSWKSKFDGLSKEKEKLDADLSSAKSGLESLRAENSKLSKENREAFDATSTHEYRVLQSKCDDLDKKNSKLDSEKKDLQNNVCELEKQIETLGEQLKSALERVPEPVVIEEKYDGTITWSDRTKFKSSLFTSPKYRVMLDRKGEYISFRPDVEGRCVCENNIIVIPSIGRYLIPKEGAHNARISVDTVMMFL